MGLFDAFQFDPQSYGGSVSGLLSGLLPQLQYDPKLAQRGVLGSDQPTSYFKVGNQQFPMFGTPDPASLPQNATPTQAQLPQAASQSAPQINATPAIFGGDNSGGVGDRLLAGLSGFQQGGKSGGLIGALTNGISGLATGQRSDPQYLQQQTQRATFQSLVDSGMPKNIAMAATLNPDILKQIAPQYFAKPQLQETGTDPLSGRKTFGIWDPVEQTLKPVGGQAAATDNGGSLDSLQKAIQAGVTGEDLYQHLPSGMAGTVKAMIEGRQPMPSTQALQSPAILALIDAAHTIDPSFDATTWQQRVAGQKDFYGGGKSADIMRKANQSALHFGELVNDKMPALPGHQMPMANTVANAINTNLLGKGAANNFMTNAHALADELAGLFKGANLSDTEIRAWESRLSPDMSVEQQQGMAKTLLGLYRDSVSALEKKREESIGYMAASKKGPILGPEAEAALQRVEQFSNGSQKTQAAPSITEGATATNPQTGQKITFRNGKWQ